MSAQNEFSQSHPDFSLEEFFPYKTRLFYTKVVTSLRAVYETRYSMKPYEWRTLAILGEHGELTANNIVGRSSMDKVSVSRAVAALDNRGWLTFRKNEKDGRSRLINLSEQGVEIYQELVPEMLAVERRILSVYSQDELHTLSRLMDRLIATDI